MKGFVDLFILFILLIVLIPAMLIAPAALKSRVQAQYLINIQSFTSTDLLLSILSATNADVLNSKKQKSSLEIVGERIKIPSQNVEFLREDLDKLVKSKCYLFESEKIKLADKSKDCPQLLIKIKEIKITKIVVPFNPTKLAEGVKLVVK